VREHYALPPSGIIYGAFNDHYKIDPNIFKIWMGILKDDVSVLANRSSCGGEDVGPSVLWALKHGAEDMLPRTAKKHKVKGERLIFSSFFPKAQHLHIKALSDLFLDTPLYNAHSTASDMLWAQVPVLTLPKEKMAARAAASIVLAGGMGIGVARNEDDYRQLAPRLARSTGRLRQPGGALSLEELARSNLFDERVFARAMLRCLRLLAEAHRLAVDAYRGRHFHILVAA
jgi:predicted O-linked N-acetylglucosamine transferase (SPINDLY family)